MLMLRHVVRHNLISAVNHLEHTERLEPVDFDVAVEVPPSPEMGDLTSNIALQLFKFARGPKSPLELAQEIAAAVEKGEEIEKVEAAAPGYVNIFLKKSAITSQLKEILDDESFGKGSPTKQKVDVEFISANPTGPLHLGNGRGGFGGDVLSNVMAFRGHDVTREYLINDGGKQIEVLGDSVKAAKEGTEPPENGYRGEHIERTAQHADSGQEAAEHILKTEIQPTVEKMGIHFDLWFSERKELHETGKVDAMLTKLKEMNLTFDEDGATWLHTSKFGDKRDRVLVKSDGSQTYLLTDLAYHWNKFKERGFDLGINFWGADHAGQVPSLQAGLKALGIPENALTVIVFQLVRLVKDGQEFKMSKRAGTFVTMDDLLDLVAEGVGDQQSKDVVRYFFLAREHNTHMDFDLDLARERSEKNPVFYIQYAYARTVGILKQAPQPAAEVDLSRLETPEELMLIKRLADLPDLLREVSEAPYPVHKLPFYAYETAALFHRFYKQHKVISDDSELTAARLALVTSMQTVIGRCLKLMGLSVPTEGMYREESSAK
jgi:arginyl-tRNA synthetase